MPRTAASWRRHRMSSLSWGAWTAARAYGIPPDSISGTVPRGFGALFFALRLVTGRGWQNDT